MIPQRLRGGGRHAPPPSLILQKCVFSENYKKYSKNPANKNLVFKKSAWFCFLININTDS